MSFPIVVIGASAGGLEPLAKFFYHLPRKLDFAVLVIQHLSPNHESVMDELLSKYTGLPITVVEEDTSLKAGHIYLNHSSKLIAADSRQKLIVSDHTRHKLLYPINFAMDSVARSFKEDAIGVILSGTGSDGSDGIKTIKEYGGLTIVQSPDQSRFDGMPNSALRTGLVDLTLPVEEIPRHVIRFFTSAQQKLEEAQIDAIKNIKALVYQSTGVDFTEYKDSTVQRRILRRMSVMGITDIPAYKELLEQTPEEIKSLANDLMIGVTKFFRDQEAFSSLEEKVIPKLFEHAKNSKKIRVWIPACSTGEEAYSIAILLAEYNSEHNLHYDISIFATDLDVVAVRNASSKTFSRSIVDQISPKRLQKFFTVSQSGYKPIKAIRDMIVFSGHNLLQDPPFSKIDLLCCRNFLIYLNASIQNKLLNMFRFVIRQDGFLFLGASESLGLQGDYFETLDHLWKVFKNKDHKALLEIDNGPRTLKSHPNLAAEKISVDDEDQSVHYGNPRLNNKITDVLLQLYVPTSMAYNNQYDLLYTTGNAIDYLKLKPGRISNSIMDLLPDEWSVAIEIGTNKVREGVESIKLNNIKAPDYAPGQNMVSILIREIKLGHLNSSVFLATIEEASAFEKHAESGPEQINVHNESRETIKLLEYQLVSSRERLQATIEELESSNEELQASNEELHSSNEELESVNEELYTLNNEYQLKALELTTANNDLNNLLRSTDIAILFLDHDLQIRKFTEPIRKIMKLEQNDIGREFSTFQNATSLGIHLEKIKSVRDTLVPYQTTIKMKNGSTYIMKVSPFRTDNNEIKGVVISLLDISQSVSKTEELQLLKGQYASIKKDLKKNQDLYEMIAERSRDMICIVDSAGRYDYVSPASVHVVGFHHDEMIGKYIHDYIHPGDDFPDLASKYDPQTFSHAIEHRFRSKSGTFEWLETTVEYITDAKGNLVQTLLSSRLITESKKAEDSLKTFQTVVHFSKNMIILTDKDGFITYVNTSFEKHTGYSLEEVLGKKPGAFLQGEETDSETVKQMSMAVKSAESMDCEIINYTKSGEKFLVNLTIQPLFDNQERLEGFFSVQQDITSEKLFDLELTSLNKMLKEKNRILKRKNKELEEFTYVVSHDLKEPIRGVINLLGLLKTQTSGMLNARAMEVLSLTQDNSQRMLKLISSLLDFSRKGSSVEEVDEFTLSDVTTGANKILAHRISTSNASIIVKNGQLKIKGYRVALEQLFQNLIDNAIKYKSEKRPIIEISGREMSDRWILRVKDNGIGIPKNQQQAIFRIFSKVRQQTDQWDEGLGIGLSICKKIASMHDGVIKVKSSPGEGSTFSLTISKNF